MTVSSGISRVKQVLKWIKLPFPRGEFTLTSRGFGGKKTSIHEILGIDP
jgi:hypothetical protein